MIVLGEGNNNTFMGYPAARPGADLSSDVAIIGAPHGTPYTPGKVSHCVNAPDAIRQASTRDTDRREHFDFDLGGVLEGITIVDCGDVPGAPDTPEDNRQAIAEAVASLLEAGVTPVLLGGDDSVPIPFVSAFAQFAPLWIVQVDAHLDWRDERGGERMGWSSPMRRMSEMEHVAGIVQVGLRGLGTARASDVADARDWGAQLVPALEVHASGIEPIVQRVPGGANILVTLDCDSLDPAVMPGVLTPVPGGLTCPQVITLIQGLGERGSIVGFDLVELMPERDIGGLSALTAYRILVNALGAIAKGRRST